MFQAAILLILIVVAYKLFNTKTENLENIEFLKLSKVLNLKFEPGDRTSGPSIHGSYNSFIINITKAPKATVHYEIRLELKLDDFGIIPDAGLNKLKTNRFLTYDIKFDSSFYMDCDNKAELTGLLNNKTRNSILYFLNNFNYSLFRISNKFILLGILNEFIDHRQILDKLTELASFISREGTAAEQLLENFYNEKGALVQENNLEVLLEAYPEISNSTEIINDAVNHSRIEIKLLGYLYKRNTCISDLKVLWEKAASQKEIQLKIIKLIEMRPDIDSGTFLLECLNQTLETEVKLKIIRLIGKTGNIDAIEPLLNISNMFFKIEAKEAVTRIQARLKGAESGQLTISDETTENGNLSISDDEKC